MKRILGYIILVVIWFGGGWLIGVATTQPEIVYETVYEEVEVTKFLTVVEVVEKPVITRIYTERIVEVFVHHEPGLREFDSRRDFINYLTWYRTEKMVNYGVDQCEDYAYDFFQQAIADGYVVSTEIVEQLYGDWHMANTVPIGNKVWLVEVSIGTVELYALKD